MPIVIKEGRHHWKRSLKSDEDECIRCGARLYYVRDGMGRRRREYAQRGGTPQRAPLKSRLPTCPWRSPRLHPPHQIAWEDVRMTAPGGGLASLGQISEALSPWVRRAKHNELRPSLKLRRAFLRCGYPWETANPMTWGPREIYDIDFDGMPLAPARRRRTANS